MDEAEPAVRGRSPAAHRDDRSAARVAPRHVCHRQRFPGHRDSRLHRRWARDGLPGGDVSRDKELATKNTKITKSGPIDWSACEARRQARWSRPSIQAAEE